MMNAFRMTKKESTWKNNKVMVLFQNPKKRMEEEKGRALQSKLFPILIFFLVQSSPHSPPSCVKAQLADGSVT